MDLNENIRIAAEDVTLVSEDNDKCAIAGFIEGATSQAAKDYWYNEFKRELAKEKLIEMNDKALEHITNLMREFINENPEILDDLDKKLVFGTGGGPTNEEIELLKKQIDEPFKWIDKDEFDALHNPMEGYDKPQIYNGKRPIGIIGCLDHGKTTMVTLGAHETSRAVIIMDIDTPLTPEERFDVMKNLKPDLSAIESIVPIADVIPEPIIPKEEFLKMHDKSVESRLTDEAYKESRAWDIKKDKKISHKRTNKKSSKRK